MEYKMERSNAHWKCEDIYVFLLSTPYYLWVPDHKLPVMVVSTISCHFRFPYHDLPFMESLPTSYHLSGSLLFSATKF
jgi:hypothetical protein